jgi:tetratricopeptide (TPR) repeat protein
MLARMRAVWVVLAACSGAVPPKVENVQPPEDPDPIVDADLGLPSADPALRPPGAIPAVPGFELPPPDPTGARSVKELRVRGANLHEDMIVVKGVVTWVYDCVAANRVDGIPEREVRKAIDADPTMCERPKFYLGDTATTPPEKSLWIVSVPRPYNKLELARIKPAERTLENFPLLCEPKTRCPPYKVGDEVIVTGWFGKRSPHGEANSDGLIVYQKMKNITQRWESVTAVPMNADVHARPMRQPALAAAPAAEEAATVIRVRQSVRETSMAAKSQGAEAYGRRKWDDAIRHFARAVEVWPENHIAWYALALSHAQKQDWKQAAAAAATTVKLKPDAAVYRLHLGWFLLEDRIASARRAEAQRRNVPVEQVAIPRSARYDVDAEAQLGAAAKRDPTLWRAHYLLGTMREAQADTRAAAEAYTRAVQLGAIEAAPWVALAELYRAWDYTDEAIAVASVGVTLVMSNAGDLWFEIGMGYSDKRLSAKAIEAFDKALDVQADHAQARFQRGQEHFRVGDLVKAKRDLEAFLESGASDGFFKQAAARMLFDIAARNAVKKP